MFLSFIRNFSAKRFLRKRSLNVNSPENASKVTTVGLLIDETYFKYKEALVGELVSYGFEFQNITILSFKNRFKKKEIPNVPYFSRKDVSWLGTIEKGEVKQFKNQAIDVLISYYDINKSPLMIVTHNSKAKFKVGFSSVDKRLNHLMIDTSIEEYQTFVSELIKYLKILNKL